MTTPLSSVPTGPGTPTESGRRTVVFGADVPHDVPLASVQGTLALDLRELAVGPDLTELDLRVGARVEGVYDRDVKLWAARFAQAVVEVTNGDRPVSQLLRWTTAAIFHQVEERARLLARTAPLTSRRRVARPQVRSVHVCQPKPGCAEVSVHVRHGERSRALAARLEMRGGRWLCTALVMG